MGPDLPLPKWADSKEFIEKIKPILFHLHSDFIDQFLKNSSGGFLFLILSNNLIKRLAYESNFEGNGKFNK